MSMNVGEIPVGTVEPVKSALAVTPVGAELALLDHTVKQTDEVFSDINECNNKPCSNGGACQNTYGTYTCQCTHGFTGRHCETAVHVGTEEHVKTGQVITPVGAVPALLDDTVKQTSMNVRANPVRTVEPVKTGQVITPVGAEPALLDNAV
ncbi:hypothetical protein ACOMHN_055014 [Nucella lapillus]